MDRLDRIRLELVGGVAPHASPAIVLLAPDGSRRDEGVVSSDDDRVLAVGVAPRLPATGEFTVRWCVVGLLGAMIVGLVCWPVATWDTPA